MSERATQYSAREMIIFCRLHSAFSLSLQREFICNNFGRSAFEGFPHHRQQQFRGNPGISLESLRDSNMCCFSYSCLVKNKTILTIISSFTLISFLPALDSCHQLKVLLPSIKELHCFSLSLPSLQYVSTTEQTNIQNSSSVSFRFSNQSVLACVVFSKIFISCFLN